MPELRAGARAPAPRASRDPGVPGASAHSPAGGENAALENPSAEEVAVWRDALADRPFAPAARDAALPAASGRYASDSPTAAAASPVLSDSARISILRPAAPSRGASAAKASAAPARAAEAPAATREKERAGRSLASGPAAVGDALEPDDETPVVDARRDASGAAPARPGRRGRRAFPLFRPPSRAARPSSRAPAKRRVRPLLLSRLLGRGALRPPPSGLLPPDLSRLKGRRPLLLPGGSPTPTRAYDLDRVEAQDPRRAEAACRRRARHWDHAALWHDGPARGVVADARWLWLWREDARWWAVRTFEEPPLLRHRGLWWSKQRGVWFALHDAELWSWRRFADWDAEGLIRLADGVELVYSADFSMVAVVTPGAGAVLYDAFTGAELGEWREEELPRRRPRAPAALRLPRGI